MKKLYMVGASVVSGIVLAVSLSSPAFAQYSSNQTSTQNYSAHSASHDEDDHDNESKDKQNYVSKDKHEDNDTSTKKEHLDCHIKDNSGNQDNYAKYGNRPNCDKTAAKTAKVDGATPANSAAQSDQAQPTVLPNAGPGNILLTAAIVTAAGYAANLLRFKYRAQQ